MGCGGVGGGCSWIGSTVSGWIGIVGIVGRNPRSNIPSADNIVIIDFRGQSVPPPTNFISNYSYINNFTFALN